MPSICVASVEVFLRSLDFVAAMDIPPCVSDSVVSQHPPQYDSLTIGVGIATFEIVFKGS
jgi:hypothetical protein